jgi:integrase
MRRGEVLGLRWQDVDLDRGVLSVVQALEETKDGLRFKAPKTKHSRRKVTLPGITVEALRRHKVEQARLRLQLGLGRDDNALVCPRIDGKPRSPRAFTKEFTRLAAKADIPPITFHGLRHSHATQLLQAGVHPKVAQERLGHSTIATTMDLYRSRHRVHAGRRGGARGRGLESRSGETKNEQILTVGVGYVTYR